MTADICFIWGDDSVLWSDSKRIEHEKLKVTLSLELVNIFSEANFLEYSSICNEVESYTVHATSVNLTKYQSDLT